MAENKKVIISIVVDDKSAKKNLNEVEKSTKKAGDAANKANKGFLGLGKTFTAIARGFVIVKSFQLLSKGITESVKILANFELQMAKVKAITGASDKEFKKLEKSAKDLALGTMFTATQVAELQLAYSKLGFTTEEILAATDATTKLATITGDDLANSADVVGSAIRGFGLDATEAGRVVDVMAKSFTSSALNLENFKQSMKTVAPIASAANISLEQTTAMLGVLADSGLRGTVAATGLRNLMSQLTDPTSKLAKELGYTINNSEGLSIAFEDLVKKNIDLATATGLTDKRTKAAFLTLLKGADKVDKLTKSLDSANGSAQEQAEIIEDTLSVSWDKFGSAIEGFILRDGAGLTSFLQKSLEGITDLINGLDEAYVRKLKLQQLDKEGGDVTRKSDIALQEELNDLEFEYNFLKKQEADNLKIYYEESEKFFSDYSWWQQQQFKEAAEIQRKSASAVADRIKKIHAEQQARDSLKETNETSLDFVRSEIRRLESEIPLRVKLGKSIDKHTEALKKLKALLPKEDPTENLEQDAEGTYKWIKKSEDAFSILNGKFSKFFKESEWYEKPSGLKSWQEELANLSDPKKMSTVADGLKLLEEQLTSLTDAFEGGDVQTQETLLARLFGTSDQDFAAIKDRLVEYSTELVNIGFDLLNVQLENRLNALERANEQELNNFDKLQKDKASRFDIEMQHQLDSFVGTEQQKADFEKQKRLEQLEFEQKQEREREALRKKQIEKENKVARNAFLADKANSLANIAIQTALGIIDYANNPVTAPLVPFVIATGAAQTAVVGSQKFQPRIYQDGGMIQGDSHANGGVPFTVAGQAGFEAEGGEYIFSRKTVNRLGVDFLDSLNFGSSRQAPSMMFANGGSVPMTAQQGLNQAELADMIGEAVAMRISEIPVVNVATETAQISRGILNAEAMATL
jgi:TP901 family phage tail tape measure protein